MARRKAARVRSKKPAGKPARRRRRRRAPPVRVSEASLAAYAHDIRTALTGILALGELLASSNLGERERRWAFSIKGSAEHLAALTSLMIDAAKADAGALRLQEELFRPRRLIEVLGDSLAARAAAKGLGAEVTVAADVPELLVGDAIRLRAALENLIDNAVKFTERGGVRLDVRAGRAARGRVRLVFTVTDSGIGLRPAEIKRLFRPFAQASAEIARRYGGTGLGLAVVKHLAQADGRRSDRHQPLRPRIAFPSLGRVRDRIHRGGGKRAAATAGAPALAVLCAGDNPYGRVILNTILAELGHRADFVGSGEEAVAAVERGYDVVLIDVMLPGIDGRETARRIRALAGTAALTPIIGITGRGETGDEDAARRAGMNAYLRKPISPSALAKALAAVARR